MNAQEAIEYIHSFFWKGSIPGLGRTQELLRRMGNPEKKLKFVHIAGTNGKGSTAAMTASILQKAGYKAGLYTSPYIYRFNERIQVNGEQIADEDVATVTEYVKQFAETMEEKPTESPQPTTATSTLPAQQTQRSSTLERAAMPRL